MNMTTYTNKRFNPLEVKNEDIEIKDIAHALSLMCRGNGQVKSFFSVCKHSINCAKEAKELGYNNRIQLILLLHDASEAYISDIIRPVKPLLTNYYDIEEKLQSLIYRKYLSNDLSVDELNIMKMIDDKVLLFELNELLHGEYIVDIKADINTKFDGFSETENEFLKLFNDLINNIDV